LASAEAGVRLPLPLRAWPLLRGEAERWVPASCEERPLPFA
jgi:hypothetical protein